MNILDSKMSSYSHGFATALFSFLYHLASYEAGNMKYWHSRVLLHQLAFIINESFLSERHDFM
jgi:hypothetical protein